MISGEDYDGDLLDRLRKIQGYVRENYQFEAEIYRWDGEEPGNTYDWVAMRFTPTPEDTDRHEEEDQDEEDWPEDDNPEEHPQS